MKSSKKLMMSSLLSVISLSGGCIDAVGTGFAAGVDSGISAVIEEVITTTLQSLLPDPGGAE
jgi:hypothetical protein